MNSPWKLISSKVAYSNPWMKIHEDIVIRPDGNPGMYGVIETNDSILIGVLNNKNKLFLIYAYSYPGKKWHWEMPGGGCDKNEDLVDASKRELYEETGIRANAWTQLPTTRPMDGLMSERMTTFLAEDLVLENKPSNEDNNIIIKGRFFSFEEIEAMIESGEIDEGQTVTALYLIEKYLAKRV